MTTPHIRSECSSSSDEALARFVAATSGDASAREKRDFVQWIEADDAHLHEIERLVRIAADVEALKPVYAKSLDRRHRPRGMSWAMSGLAACFAVILAVVAMPARTVTANQERPETVTLSDGTRIHLDAGGAVDIPYFPWSRSVRLTTGEAVFDVVHNDHRPFVVHAGDVEVTDVGTRFLVQNEPGRMTVAVFEGEVDIGPAKGPPVRLKAHQAAAITAGNIHPIPMMDEDETTAWRLGRLVFKDTSLTDVAARLSRYRSDKVVIGSPAIAELRVSGSFALNNQDGVLRALEKVLPISVRHTASETVLLPASIPPARQIR